MFSLIDKLKIEKSIRDILEALGEDINREGLRDTPKRVANMYEEIFMGVQYSNNDIADLFNVTFEEDLDYDENNIVMIKDIETFSFCEHHMALMYNMKINVAYIPQNKVIGFSKVVRICDLVCRRLQIQERIGKDIAYIIKKITETDNVAVFLKAEHSCITMRGIKKNNTNTVSMSLNGRFKTDTNLLNKIKLMM